MHVYDEALEPGALAIAWAAGDERAAVLGLSEYEAFALLDALGGHLGQPGLIDGLSSRMTLLLEPGSLVLSRPRAACQLAIVRPWQRVGARPTASAQLTAITDRLEWPVVHADVTAAAGFIVRQERLRPALAGAWRRFAAEAAPADQAPTRLELRLGARRAAAA